MGECGGWVDAWERMRMGGGGGWPSIMWGSRSLVARWRERCRGDVPTAATGADMTPAWHTVGGAADERDLVQLAAGHCCYGLTQ
jgi:hypothetical protein